MWLISTYGVLKLTNNVFNSYPTIRLISTYGVLKYNSCIYNRVIVYWLISTYGVLKYVQVVNIMVWNMD